MDRFISDNIYHHDNACVHQNKHDLFNTLLPICIPRYHYRGKNHFATENYNALGLFCRPVKFTQQQSYEYR